MKSDPLVSIVMPTFNRIQYLSDAVDSVTNQDLDDWEFIIVDDGSDEPVRAYLSTLRDPRVLVDYQPHTGVPAVARNVGIARARGRYIAFIDSDDRWLPEKLRRQLELMRSAPERRWSYSSVRQIAASGSVMERAPSKPWTPFDGSIIERLLLIEAQIATPTVVAELSLVREVGGFDESLRFIEDYDLWSRLALRSEVSVARQPLADVRHHPHQFTWDQIGKHCGWTQYYEKMERLVQTRRLRRLCRHQKRKSVLTLAAAQARAGRWGQMFRTLRRAISMRAFRLRGWLRVAATAASTIRQGNSKSTQRTGANDSSNDGVTKRFHES